MRPTEKKLREVLERIIQAYLENPDHFPVSFQTSVNLAEEAVRESHLEDEIEREKYLNT